MEQLTRQIRLARRQLALQRFLAVLPWYLCGTLAVAASAIVYQKLYPGDFDGLLWAYSALGAGFAAGILSAAGHAWLTRGSELSAAIEIDRRFGLQERISSTLALGPAELATPAGQAVLHDAMRRVERIDLGRRFGVRAGRRLLLPLLPAVLAFAVAVLFDQRNTQSAAQAAPAEEIEAQIQRSAEDLRRRIEEQRQRAAAEGLKDADDLFDELERGLRDLDSPEKPDQKQALARLNNMAEKLQQRRQEIGGAEAVRKQLERLADFPEGPAEKMARAMQQGDFRQAADEFEALREQLQAGELSDQQREQLAEQLERLRQQLAQAAAEQRQELADLQRQIEQARQQGNLEQAGRLQDRLDQLQRQAEQNAALDQLAQRLEDAAGAMREGDAGGLDEALADLGDQLQQLQQQMREAEMLDRLDQDMQLAKAGLCEECLGGAGGEPQAGDLAGAGGQQGGDPQVGDQQGGDQQGGGIGVGQGTGVADGDDTEISTFDSQVRGEIASGRATVVGDAEGPNLRGQVRQAIRDEFEQVGGGRADPLTGQPLPRAQQTHVEEYFEAVRRGTR